MTSQETSHGPLAPSPFQNVLQTIKELLVLQSIVPATLLAVLSYLASFLTPRTQPFNPDSDIPDLGGKVILITGASAGIGKETVFQLAKHNPERIYLAARTRPKAEAAIADIKAVVPNAQLQFLHLDLSSFSSIRDAAVKFTAETARLDLLVNNADKGIMATPLAMTEDGFEAQFGINYTGHALLTRLLLPILLKTAKSPAADVRIINVSSIGHNMAPRGGIIFDHSKLMSYGPSQLYGHSKLANILLTKSLAKRYPQLLSIAVHPGLIMTELYAPAMKANFPIRMLMTFIAPLFFSSTQCGALNQLWASTVPRSTVENGGYYMPVGQKMGASKDAKDKQSAEGLWEWTEEQFRKHGF